MTIADSGCGMNPEFMRETTAVKDFADPPFTVIGSRDERAAKRAAELYSKLNAPVELTSIREAEMIKTRMNSAMTLKVPLKVEVGWGKNWEEGK